MSMPSIFKFSGVLIICFASWLVFNEFNQLHFSGLHNFPSLDAVSDSSPKVDLGVGVHGQSATVVAVRQPSKIFRHAILFKLHSLSDYVEDRLNHLINDVYCPNETWKTYANTDGSSNRIEYFIYILYDKGLLTNKEVEELENKYVSHRNTVVKHYSGKVKLFGFSAHEMHSLYPTQYPKSDFQPPNVAWQRGELQGRLRHIAHDNPEIAYLLWWKHEKVLLLSKHNNGGGDEFGEVGGDSGGDKVKSRSDRDSDQVHQIHHAKHHVLTTRDHKWDKVWGMEYDVAMSDWGVDSKSSMIESWLNHSWQAFLRDADALDTTMKNVDLLATMVGWRPWNTWSFGGRINFGRPQDEAGRDFRVGIYTPLIRFSSRALDMIHDGYSNGKVGYVEVAMSTLCAMNENCEMANISSRWLGHFDYRPVIHPSVFEEIKVKRPGLLFHPVKSTAPLSSILLDKAYATSTSSGDKTYSSSGGRERKSSSKGYENSSSHQLVTAPDRLTLSAPQRKYKPAAYFLSGQHVPWEH